MTAAAIPRPEPSEYVPYYETYISQVPKGNLLKVLEDQRRETQELLADLSEARALHRYAPGKWSIKEVVGHLYRRRGDGKLFSIIVVAESGEQGRSFRLAEEIGRLTGLEPRVCIFGHIQRGGTPTAFDRWLATRFGLHAVDAVHDGDFGKMVALRGTDIVRVPIAEATAKLKTVDPKLYDEVGVFFG